MFDFKDIFFAHPLFFNLLLALPFLFLWYWRNYRQRYTELKLPVLNVKKIAPSWKIRLRKLLVVLRVMCFGFLVLAIARPQTAMQNIKISADAIDIIFSMDVSSSMLAEDFAPNRIEASKEIALDFIEQHPTDRFGIVAFAAESFTQCPLTTDHTVAANLMSKLGPGMIEDGTAIGMGLATSVNRLKSSAAKSKVVILLTDGVNNPGEFDPVDPLTAAEIAATFNVKVYTIGVGTRGYAPYTTPVGVQNVKVEIDEELLKEIAQKTNGKYFRATSNKRLTEIYKEIDLLEKTKMEVNSVQYYTEKFRLFAILALLVLLVELVLKYTLFKKAI